MRSPTAKLVLVGVAVQFCREIDVVSSVPRAEVRNAEPSVPPEYFCSVTCIPQRQALCSAAQVFIVTVPEIVAAAASGGDIQTSAGDEPAVFVSCTPLVGPLTLFVTDVVVPWP